jgi:uncharacterized membrane protein
MRFASPFPWWLAVVLVVGAAFAAYRAYARPIIPLSVRRRGVLMGLRFTVFLLLLLFLAQPVRLEPAAATDTVVAVLLDQSRSMAVADVAGASRMDAAVALIRDRIRPSLGTDFQVELLGFGETLAPVDLATVRAEDRRSDLTAAIDAVQTRYADRSVAGIVVVSDGGDTGGAGLVHPAGAPVFTIGVGAPEVARDREVLDLSAGQAVVDESVIDLSVSVVGHGFGRASFEVRVIEDGQLLRVLEVTPPADGGVLRTVVPVSPKPETATLYTVEIPSDPTELVAENNVRSVLVEPPGRPRRVLLVEGAPGYEHSFLKRTLHGDPGIVVDAVVKKGQNDRGERTFYIQGAAERTRALASGYPTTREALFEYDAIILANVDVDLFRPAQVEMTAAFVAERGGGLLVMGARSFEARGWQETPLEPLLPLTPTDRRGVELGLPDAVGSPHQIALTADGEDHPIMRLDGSGSETRSRWDAAPTLGNVASLGSPRPGAAVLATTTGDDAGERPVIAVQRFGRGRTMVFAGEASWRWKMLLPSTDQIYDRFWRQTARWLGADAPEPIMLRVEGGRAEGDPLRIDVVVADEAFAPVLDAAVRVRVTDPNGDAREMLATPVVGEPGWYAAEVAPSRRGVHQVSAVVDRGSNALGRADVAALVGGADLELTDPRRQDAVLQRVAAASGGRLLNLNDDEDIDDLAGVLRAHAIGEAAPTVHEMWNSLWGFLLVASALSMEWGLRRRWGLR